jgi:hypothetical protein
VVGGNDSGGDGGGRPSQRVVGDAEGVGGDGSGLGSKQRIERNLRRRLLYATKKATVQAQKVASLKRNNAQLEEDVKEERRAGNDAVARMKDEMSTLQNKVTNLGTRLKDRTDRFTTSISKLKATHKAKHNRVTAALATCMKEKDTEVEAQRKKKRKGVELERQKGESRLKRSRKSFSSYLAGLKVSPSEYVCPAHYISPY